MARGKEQQAGMDFEEGFAELIGGDLTPGSGNQWYALMDVGDATILWSLKHTGKDQLSVNRNLLQEVIKAAKGIGGRGLIPGVATDISGEAFIVLSASDFARIVQEDIKISPPSQADEKRANAKIPLALRKVMEEE